MENSPQSDQGLNKKERAFIAALLVAIVILVLTDLVSDSFEGAAWWHLVAEGMAASSALIGIFFLMKDSFQMKHSLENERRDATKFKAEAEQWKSQARKYIDGLSQAIDQQLSAWNLSVSEKEVALLLLKGLSLKEIAEIRETTEKTARAHSMAIYSKSGLSGRSELAAFFLEDLLLPPTENNG